MKKRKTNDELWRIAREAGLFKIASDVDPSIYSSIEVMWECPFRDEAQLWLDDAVDEFLLEVAQDVYQGELSLDEAERRFKKRVRFILRKICKGVKFDFNRFMEEN